MLHRLNGMVAPAASECQAKQASKQGKEGGGSTTHCLPGWAATAASESKEEVRLPFHTKTVPLLPWQSRSISRRPAFGPIDYLLSPFQRRGVLLPGERLS